MSTVSSSSKRSLSLIPSLIPFFPFSLPLCFFWSLFSLCFVSKCICAYPYDHFLQSASTPDGYALIRLCSIILNTHCFARTACEDLYSKPLKFSINTQRVPRSATFRLLESHFKDSLLPAHQCVYHYHPPFSANLSLIITKLKYFLSTLRSESVFCFRYVYLLTPDFPASTTVIIHVLWRLTR